MTIWSFVKSTVPESAGIHVLPVWDRFSKTPVGGWYNNLKSPRTKAAVAIGAGLLALSVVRTAWRMMQPDMESPPPAYQGTYARMEGLSKEGLAPYMRQMFSDFGSPVRLNKTANKPVLRHTSYSVINSRRHTGFVQGMM